LAVRCGRRKKRSGWKHPLDINRNHRRCAKRRRSASAGTRHALQALREAELLVELREARTQVRGPRRRGGLGRRPSRGDTLRPRLELG
jgi:hypothetical protein